MAACVVWLAGCTTSTKISDLWNSSGETTGSVVPPVEGSSGPGLLGSDPQDDLSLGKKQFRANNYGLAEQHFRKAVEVHPKDAEAWVGLAASYDRLRRFDLADRAYKEALKLLGPTPELLNNQGFSYLLRGDYARARKTLREAQELDPRNPYILNNINLLERSARKRKGIE
jgi:Flp pilus assembly protein TadD